MGHERVEVWCSTTHRWVDGFEIDDVDDDGSVHVHLPGGPELPEPISPDVVRPVTQHRQPWQVTTAPLGRKRFR